ncbi:MAG TPA: hypothetical protein PKD55_09670 [Bellilinea sp.]|nr:hypothetical protein [Bellilinea sp.]
MKQTQFLFGNNMRVKVFVHENRESAIQMHPDMQDDWRALFHPYDLTMDAETGRIQWQKEIGEIHLVEGDYGSEIVSHEALHATLWWAKAAMFDPTDDRDEEVICLNHGRLVGDIWRWHYAEQEAEHAGDTAQPLK